MNIEKTIPFAVKISLILIYVMDGLTKYIHKYLDYNFLILPNRFLKIVILLFAVIYVFFVLTKIDKNIYRVYLLLFILFIIFFFNNFLYGTNANYLIKYSCFFLFTPVFFSNIDEFSWARNVSLTMKYLVCINLFFIICGLITNVELLKTYSSRFGCNGLLLTPMQSTYFYISVTMIALKLRDKFFIAISLISSLLVGTKILLGFVVCVGFYFVFVKVKNIRLKTTAIFILLVSFSTIFLLFFNQKLFKNIIYNQGILSAVSSHRSDLFNFIWKSLPEINFNIISGGTNLENYRVEMDFVDVLLYFGGMGFFVFLSFFKLLKDVFITNKLALFYFTIVLFFITIGGNFLYYPVNTFIFLVTLKTLSYQSYNTPQN